MRTGHQTHSYSYYCYCLCARPLGASRDRVDLASRGIISRGVPFSFKLKNGEMLQAQKLHPNNARSLSLLATQVRKLFSVPAKPVFKPPFGFICFSDSPGQVLDRSTSVTSGACAAASSVTPNQTNKRAMQTTCNLSCDLPPPTQSHALACGSQQTLVARGEPQAQVSGSLTKTVKSAFMLLDG